MTLTLAALAAAALLGAPTEPTKTFTVHEWGTFTSLSGPTDQHVPHRLRIAEDLPPWVQARFVGDRWLSADSGDFVKSALTCSQRMETPVLYFHAPAPMEVSVEVRMPKGLITEVYPPVSATLPLTLSRPEIPQAGSMVRWDRVRVVPEVCCDFLAFKDAGKSHYAQARLTKGDGVHVKVGNEEHTERFLFYRGVGTMDLGVNAVPLGRDRFKMTFGQANLRTTAFAIENWGGRFRFSMFQNVTNDCEIALRPDQPDVEVGTLPLQAFPSYAPCPDLVMSKEGRNEADLAAAMTRALTDAGLDSDEATAMVATWKHHWFSELGTRVLVLLPQSTIDEHLPLTITPTPSKTTRVFVSRLELLTPERLQWVRGVMAQTPRTPADREIIEAEFKKLGRFREPAIKMAEQWTGPIDGC